MNRSFLLTSIGLLLGVGAPLGAFLSRLLTSSLPWKSFLAGELEAFPFFYTYMLLGTCLAFGLFGFFAGRDEDRVLLRNRLLKDETLTDPLTGLGNHRSLHDTFKVEFRRHQDSRLPLSCFMMDLDLFKRVNDTYGHPFGDRVLKVFARIVEENVRKGDISARYGGEEFLCILPNCVQKEAQAVAERIRGETERQVFRCGPHDVKVTVSVGGVTSCDPSPTDYQALIATADANLYRAKGNGRNQVAWSILTSQA
jgi:diguanylate cyclase (GGDEF)-like protein